MYSPEEQLERQIDKLESYLRDADSKTAMHREQLSQCNLECARLRDELAELRAWAYGAYVCLQEGAALMPREQLGQWGGVRGLIESYPGEDDATNNE